MNRLFVTNLLQKFGQYYIITNPIQTTFKKKKSQNNLVINKKVKTCEATKKKKSLRRDSLRRQTLLVATSVESIVFGSQLTCLAMGFRNRSSNRCKSLMN
jgi:hypothetical protein